MIIVYSFIANTKSTETTYPSKSSPTTKNENILITCKIIDIRI